MEWDLESCYCCNYYLAFTSNYCWSERAANFAPILPLPSRSEPQPDPEGTEGVILLFVTVKVINPDRRSDYKNYLTRDVHSNDVQSLNRVKSLLQEELGELRAWILMWDSIGAISKYGCTLIMM